MSPQNTVESFHVDVYYMDGCSQQAARIILDKVGDLLVNDGLCRFGFGGHNSQDEFLVGKYNVIVVYGAEHECFTDFFEKYDIPEKIHKEVLQMELIIPESKDVKRCAKVYISAYQVEPWNEVYEETEVENYNLKNGFEEIESVLLYKEIK